MVPMIIGPTLVSEEEEKKDKQSKRMEQRVKRLRSLGHTVNYVSAQEEFYPAAPIVFTEQDLQVVRLPHQDPLVVKLQVDKAILGWVLIDGGSSAEVLFWDAFQKMGLDGQMLVPMESSLVAFDGTRVFPKGVAHLMVHAVERTLPVNFLVIESRSAFNVIMGRGWIHAMYCMVSTLHQVMRCHSPDGQYTINIHGNQSQARKCHSICISNKASTSGTKEEEEL